MAESWLLLPVICTGLLVTSARPPGLGIAPAWLSCDQSSAPALCSPMAQPLPPWTSADRPSQCTSQSPGPRPTPPSRRCAAIIVAMARTASRMSATEAISPFCVQASTPPSSWYMSPQVAELEKHAIFHNNWQVGWLSCMHASTAPSLSSAPCPQDIDVSPCSGTLAGQSPGNLQCAAMHV